MTTELIPESTDASLSNIEIFGGPSGLGIAWLLAGVMGAHGSADMVAPFSFHQSAATQETVQEVVVVSPTDLLKALANLSTRLGARATPIEPEVHEVLYNNLWSLYQE